MERALGELLPKFPMAVPHLTSSCMFFCLLPLPLPTPIQKPIHSPLLVKLETLTENSTWLGSTIELWVISLVTARNIPSYHLTHNFPTVCQSKIPRCKICKTCQTVAVFSSNNSGGKNAKNVKSFKNHIKYEHPIASRKKCWLTEMNVLLTIWSCGCMQSDTTSDARMHNVDIASRSRSAHPKGNLNDYTFFNQNEYNDYAYIVSGALRHLRQYYNLLT